MRKFAVIIVIVVLAIAAIFSIVHAVKPPTGPIDPVGETPPASGWKAVTVTGGVMHPWAAVWLPDQETVLITEREGRLRVFEDGQLRMEPVAGLPDILSINQGGLMDIVLHPSFAENRLVYLAYSAGTPDANRTTLGRGRLAEDLSRLDDFEVIFRVNEDKPGGQHFGSRLLWLPDGTLLMSIGDGGNPPIKVGGHLTRFNAQDLASHLGKVLRMDENGKPAADNPWADDDDPETDPYIWTYGHRNIQGIARHPETGDIWATEHGARGGDELNLLKAGENYGWPEATYSAEYFGPRISEHTTCPAWSIRKSSGRRASLPPG